MLLTETGRFLGTLKGVAVALIGAAHLNPAMIVVGTAMAVSLGSTLPSSEEMAERQKKRS